MFLTYRLTSYLINIKIFSVKIYLFVFILSFYYLVYFSKRNIFLSYVRLNESKLEKKRWDIYTGDGRAFAFKCMPINFTTTCNRAFHGRKIHSGGGCRPGVGGFGLQIRLVSYLAVLRNELRWGGSHYGSIMQMHKHIICLCRWGEILACEGSLGR